MTDSTPSWLVRLTYRAPAPADHGGHLTEYVKQERCFDHTAAHATARRWANTPLPPGAVDPNIEIEHRDANGRSLRTEPWTIPDQPAPTRREAVDQARRRLAG